MISDPELVRELLRTAPMPPVPAAPSPGIAWLRAHVPRFCDGPVHRRRRAAVQRELDRLDPLALRADAAARVGQPLAHVRVLLAAMGIPESAVTAVCAVADAYQPHQPITPAADAAVGELVALCAEPANASPHTGTSPAGALHQPVRAHVAARAAVVDDMAFPDRTASPVHADRGPGDDEESGSEPPTEDERIAARICILVQACAATGELVAAARASHLGAPADRPALIMATTPPLRATRRLVDGVVTELDLRHPGLGFGAGPHRCPGSELAVALAGGILASETARHPADPSHSAEPHHPADTHDSLNASPGNTSVATGNGGATKHRSRGRNTVSSNAFHALHRDGRPLVLPNAWDFTSGALLVDAGFPAIATTSLGVAAAAGLPDGKAASADETFALAARLTRLPVLVSVDIEAGFAEDPAEVADYVARLADLGVAGINIEDGRDNTRLAAPHQHADLITIIKDRTPHLFVNARVDTYWFGIDEDSTAHRARLYAAAGADGLFVPGATDPTTLRTLVAATTLPLNTLYAPAGPDIDTLGALGVRRISTGSALYRAALGAAVGLARTVRGDLSEPSTPPDYRRIQALLAAANTD
ncbi:isocitrate lyase/PEP mutase family protein [Nocardia canadensis]|uniref:isocitrate lyase/PEP mutase family protein n=1 Tax=Nocardia canadensis TaxID=3065238 RepID=UPI00292CD515|nr:isocitrate lyase/phosphoenolpyruvate mutase family protein [Nocardia canadensis]